MVVGGRNATLTDYLGVSALLLCFAPLLPVSGWTLCNDSALSSMR